MIEIRGRCATCAEAGSRRDRELASASFRRGSKNVPLPVHLEVRDERVPVRDRAPARVGVQVDAGQAERRAGAASRPVLPSGRNPLPSRSSSASNFPAPRPPAPSSRSPRRPAAGWSNGDRSGASEMIAPTLRSRFGQPSSRLPMPGANESSTVEWQSAHWMPDRRAARRAVEEARDADDRVQLQQRQRRRRIVEIDCPALMPAATSAGTRLGVDLQTRPTAPSSG